MEVRPGQRSSTIAQAMAHNLSTIERDLDMFKPLVAARGETALLETIEAGHEAMKIAYARFLECFVNEIQIEVAHQHHHDVNSDDAVGNERVHEHHEHIHPVDQALISDATDLLGERDADLQSAMTRAAHSAERYETR